MPSISKALKEAWRDLGHSYKTMTRVRSDELSKPTLASMWKEVYRKKGVKGVAAVAGHAFGMFVPGAQFLYVPSQLFVRASQHYKMQKLDHLTGRLEASYGYSRASARVLAKALLLGEEAEISEEDVALNRLLVADIASGQFDPEA